MNEVTTKLRFDFLYFKCLKHPHGPANGFQSYFLSSLTEMGVLVRPGVSYGRQLFWENLQSQLLLISYGLSSLLKGHFPTLFFSSCGPHSSLGPCQVSISRCVFSAKGLSQI